MATYHQIRHWVKQEFGFVPRPCWIAHCKELAGLPVKPAHNRQSDQRKITCDDPRKREAIFAAFKHFWMIREIQHPAFLQPSNLEATLWRYMDFEKFKNIVDHSRLFMPAVIDLGDPHEGTFSVADKSWWQKLEEDADSEKKRETIKHNKNFLSNFAKLWKRHMFVSCWQMSCCENYSMWKRYCKDSSEALAIKSRYLSLITALPDFAHIGKIRYIDYETERIGAQDMPNMFEFIMHKRIGFRDDSEVRAVVGPPVTTEDESDDISENFWELNSSPEQQFFAPKVDLTRLIQSIVLHPNASEIFQYRITDFCHKNGLPKPTISHMRDKPNEYL